MKTVLTPRDRVKAAYLHLVLGVEVQTIAVALEVNMGRVSEAITALELAASDPKEARRRMSGPPMGLSEESP